MGPPYFSQYSHPNFRQFQRPHKYVKTGHTLLIFGGVLNGLLNFFLLLVSAVAFFGIGMLFGIFGIFISLMVFIIAYYYKRLKHLEFVFVVVTIYFIFVLIEIIVVPIAITALYIPPQFAFILFTPILILAILTFVFMTLSKKYIHSTQSPQSNVGAKAI